MRVPGMKSPLFRRTTPVKKIYSKPLEVHYRCSHLLQGLRLRIFQLLKENLWGCLQMQHFLSYPSQKFCMILVQVCYTWKCANHYVYNTLYTSHIELILCFWKSSPVFWHRYKTVKVVKFLFIVTLKDGYSFSKLLVMFLYRCYIT